MIVVNGFGPGEKVARAIRPTAPHSIVETSTTRIGSSFNFRYAVRCACGKRFSNKGDHSAPFRRQEKHAKEQASCRT